MIVLAKHRGTPVILGPEFKPMEGIAISRGEPGEKWYQYIMVDADSRIWSAIGAAPMSEFTEVRDVS